MAKTSSSSSSIAGFRPLHDKILVKRDEASTKTESGLYIPDKAKDVPKTGIIEAIGTGSLNTETGELIPLTVKKGNKVLFSSYAGSEIKIDGKDFIVMSEDEVLAIIDD